MSDSLEKVEFHVLICLMNNELRVSQRETKARTNLAADKLEVAVARFRVDADHNALDESVREVVSSVRTVTEGRQKYVDLQQLVGNWQELAAWFIETSFFITLIQLLIFLAVLVSILIEPNIEVLVRSSPTRIKSVQTSSFDSLSGSGLRNLESGSG